MASDGDIAEGRRYGDEDGEVAKGRRVAENAWDMKPLSRIRIISNEAAD